MNKHAEMKELPALKQGISVLSFNRLLGMLAGLSLCVVIAGALVFWSQNDLLPLFEVRSDNNHESAVLGAQNSDGDAETAASSSGNLIGPGRYTDIFPNHSLAQSSSDQNHPAGYPVKDLGSGSDNPLEMIRSRKILENDIARSLMMMENIKGARVLLSLPERSGQDVSKASASVIIDMGPVQTLSPHQIKAVSYLIAASVPTLEAGRVTLIDQRGQLLNYTDNRPFPDAQSGALAYKNRLEEFLTGRIINILSPIVGFDGLRAEVTVELNSSASGHSTGDSDLESKDSNNNYFSRNPIFSSKKTAETLAPSDALAEEAQVANTPAAPMRSQSARRMTRYKNRKQIDKDPTPDSDRVVTASVRRVSAVVVVDDRKTSQADAVGTIGSYKQDELDRFSGLVKQVVGFDEKRGDQVTVTQAAFLKTDPTSARSDLPVWRQSWFNPVLKQLTAGSAILLLFFYIVRPLIRYGLGQNGHPRDKNITPATDSAQSQEKGNNSTGFSSNPSTHFRKIISDLPNSIADILLFETPDHFQHRLQYINKITDADPRLVAEVIKSWSKKSDNELDHQLDQAALLMLSLGMDRASRVIGYLSPREVQTIGIAMAKVDDMSADSLEAAVEQFLSTVKNQNFLLVDKEAYITTMLTMALGEEKAQRILERILPGILTKSIQQFKWMNSQSVAEMIGKEHPQIIAIILSTLDSRQAAEVLMLMPEALRSDVMLRIASLKGVQTSALRELDQMIDQQFPLSDVGNSAPIGGVEFAAHVLNHVDSKSSELILGQIADQSWELAQNIQDKMFVFDDLIHLDAKGMQTVLREISTGQLLLALKDAGEALKEKIFKNMSRRAAEMMREDLTMMGETNPGEIDLARKDILNTVKKLVDAGELKLKIDEG